MTTKLEFGGHFHVVSIGMMSALLAQLDAHLTGDQEIAGSTPTMSVNFFVEIDHELFSTVILCLPLIQEGQLSVSSKRMCIILVKRLED